MIAYRLRAASFFLLFYLYFWLRIDPGLLYQAQEPVFFGGSAFLQNFWSLPGGWAEYLSSFLTQFFFYPWAGALIVTAIAWLVSRLTRSFIAALGGAPYQCLSLVPAILLLALHSHYRYPLTPDIALLITLLCVVVYLRIPLDRAPLRFICFLLLSAFLYYAVAAPYLLFAALCGIFEFLTRRHRRLGAACLASIPVIVYSAAYILQTGIPNTLARSLPFTEIFQFNSEPGRIAIALALYLFFPLVAFGRTFRQRGIDSGSRACNALAWLAASKPLNYARTHAILRTLVFLVAAIIPALLAFAGNSKILLQIDQYTQNRKWRQSLEKAGHLQEYNTLAVYNSQRALYHAGQLPDSMFSFPLVANVPIILPTSEGNAPLSALSEILLELGAVNQAEHMAHEALEIFGERPSILSRLVLINTLKGRIQVARIFLNLLDKTVLYQDWAAGYRSALEADSLGSFARELAQIRSLMFTTDRPGFLEPEVLLHLLIEENRQNRMAFEYLMAHYLLTGQIGGIVENLDRLNDFPDHFPRPAIPQHYEEAVLLYMAKRVQQGNSPDLSLYGRKIRSRTMQRFRDFDRLLATYQDDMAVARRELAETHGDTYWFYFFFRYSRSAQTPPSPTRTANPQQ